MLFGKPCLGSGSMIWVWNSYDPKNVPQDVKQINTKSQKVSHAYSRKTNRAFIAPHFTWNEGINKCYGHLRVFRALVWFGELGPNDLDIWSSRVVIQIGLSESLRTLRTQKLAILYQFLKFYSRRIFLRKSPLFQTVNISRIAFKLLNINISRTAYARKINWINKPILKSSY